MDSRMEPAFVGGGLTDFGCAVIRRKERNGAAQDGDYFEIEVCDLSRFLSEITRAR